MNWPIMNKCNLERKSIRHVKTSNSLPVEIVGSKKKKKANFFSKKSLKLYAWGIKPSMIATLRMTPQYQWFRTSIDFQCKSRWNQSTKQTSEEQRMMEHRKGQSVPRRREAFQPLSQASWTQWFSSPFSGIWNPQYGIQLFIRTHV